MACKEIIDTSDISKIYKVPLVNKINFISDTCLGDDLKECYVDLFDSSSAYMTYTPIHRKYHKNTKLRSYSGYGKVAEHKLFVLNEEFRDKGIAKSIKINEDKIYKANNFNEVHIDAAFDGVNVWRALNYKYVDEKTSKMKIFNMWRKYIFDLYEGEDKLTLLSKYKNIDVVPKKYLKLAGKDSMGEWLRKSQRFPIVEMYRRVV